MTPAKILCTAMLAAAMGACTSSPDMERPAAVYFTEDISVYPAGSVNVDSVEGRLLIPEAIGGRRFAVGSGLIVVLTSDSPIFKVYTSDGDSVGSYGIEGQGPDDFLPGKTLGSTVMTDGDDRIIWINDINGRAMKRLNLTRSIARGSAVVDSVVPTAFGCVNTIMAGQRLVMEEMNNDGYVLKMRQLSQPVDSLATERMYLMPTDNFYLFRSDFSASPDGRHLVAGMHNFNQINILDLTDMSRTAISLGNVRTTDEAFDYRAGWTRYNEYIGVAAADDAAFGLYIGKKNDEDRAPGTEIHRVSYDGRITGRYGIRETLNSIAAGSGSDCFYGMDSDDNIFIYKVK